MQKKIFHFIFLQIIISLLLGSTTLRGAHSSETYSPREANYARSLLDEYKLPAFITIKFSASENEKVIGPCYINWVKHLKMISITLFPENCTCLCDCPKTSEESFYKFIAFNHSNYKEKKLALDIEIQNCLMGLAKLYVNKLSAIDFLYDYKAVKENKIKVAAKAAFRVHPMME